MAKKDDEGLGVFFLRNVFSKEDSRVCGECEKPTKHAISAKGLIQVAVPRIANCLRPECCRKFMTTLKEHFC